MDPTPSCYARSIYSWCHLCIYNYLGNYLGLYKDLCIDYVQQSLPDNGPQIILKLQSRSRVYLYSGPQCVTPILNISYIYDIMLCTNRFCLFYFYISITFSISLENVFITFAACLITTSHGIFYRLLCDT